MSTTTTKSLKGLSHDQILAETNHFFTEAASTEHAIPGNGSKGGPECFLLNEREFLLVNELEALENSGAPLKQQKAVILQIRAVIRSIQALGCANTVEYPR